MCHRVLILLSGLLLFMLPNTLVRAQSAGDAKLRWEKLTPQERERVKKNYDEWKSLSAERREEMERRHRELAEIRKEAVAQGLDPAAVRNLLKQRRLELIGGAGASRDRLDELEIADLEPMAREKAAERLRKLVKRGLIDTQEMERLLTLEPRELGSEMRSLNREAFLRDPPQRFRELPAAERERLAALPPESFFRELHQVIPPPRSNGPSGWLDRFAPPVEPGRPPMFDPRIHYVKQWLDHNLSPEENARIREADPIERRKLVIQILLQRAKATLRARGEKPNSIEKLERAPRGEREIQLIQIIDPSAVPPPPLPPGENGPRRFKFPRVNKPNR